MSKATSFKYKNNKKKLTLLDKLSRMKKPPSVKVGFPKSQTFRYPSGISVIQVAIIQEFGAVIEHPGGTPYGYKTEKSAELGKVRFLKKGEGFMEIGVTGPHKIVIPPRPFMETTKNERKKEVLNFQKDALKYLIKNGGSLEKLLGEFGAKYADFIRETITKFSDPPNAPSTIAHKKGVDNPLIDTGTMRQSVTWEINHGY